MKVKGHTTIILTDKDGKEQRFDDDNMETNAIEKLLANCGWMNRDNLDQSNLVEDLLGGILALDTALTEDADLIHVPAGVKMTANGSILNTSMSAEVSELGQYSAQESGWSQDGSTYTMTFDYGTSQGNGTIACVCLTGKNYGLAGEGNALSKAVHSTRPSIVNLAGTPTAISGISGSVFAIDLIDSSCMALSVEDVEGTATAYLRKYRLPISKVNLKGTPTAPVMLSEDTLTLPAWYDGATVHTFAHDGKLEVWNVNMVEGETASPWGSGFTQNLWTISADGTSTDVVLSNTSGDTLKGLIDPIFDGNYIYFVNAWWQYSYPRQNFYDTRKIYVFNRNSGVITTITSEFGSLVQINGSGTDIYFWQDAMRQNARWAYHHGSGDGRIVCTGREGLGTAYEGGAVYDITLGAMLTNANGNVNATMQMPVSGLIRHSGLTLYREQGYIASINNLSTPVTKEADKAMKIIYRLTFEEQEEE